MKLSIYEVYVNIEDQPQADRMKQMCIDYGLPYWSDWKYAFECRANSVFEYDDFAFEFYCSTVKTSKTQVTESEFLELVKMLNKC